MYGFIFKTLSLIFVCFGVVFTTANAQGASNKDSSSLVAGVVGQLRVSVDISQPIINLTTTTRQSLEGSVDYYYRKELYIVLEGGAGRSKIDYADLKYESNNFFVKGGFDKSLLVRNGASDWDAIFIGLRYGMAFINRGAATYETHDQFWGVARGTVAAQDIRAQWAEITGGMRMELLPRFFAGWNIRGKFLLNSGSFKELPPAFISGYGRGEKNSVFDFNLYLSYAFRWEKRQASKPKAQKTD